MLLIRMRGTFGDGRIIISYGELDLDDNYPTDGYPFPLNVVVATQINFFLNGQPAAENAPWLGWNPLTQRLLCFSRANRMEIANGTDLSAYTGISFLIIGS